MNDQLSALDATFLELEQADEGATMHIGGVMVFEAPDDGRVPTLTQVCANLAPRLAQVPRYSQRLSDQRTGGLAWPSWEPDPHFDLANHVRRAALPAPGGDKELCEWAADFFSHRLDRTRPLWEMVLLEGLEEGRWAVAHKTHHSLVDGVGSVGMAQLLLDLDRQPGHLPHVPARAHYEPEAFLLPGPALALAGAGLRTAATGLHAVLHPRETFQTARSLAEVIVRNEIHAAPRTSINAPIGAARRFAIVRARLDEVKEIGRRLGGSVNDVVLAACTTGLRELIIARGEAPPQEGLRAMVPVNVRDVSERMSLGNRISSLFVELPLAEPQALARLHLISQRTARLKSSGAGRGASAMLDAAALAPPVLHAFLARSIYATRLFNVTITNVPGPQVPLYSLGASLREIYPLVPLAADHAVGIAIFSYNGGLVLGVNADRDSTGDLDVLVDGIERGFDQLRELSHAARREAPSRRRGRAHA